MFLMLMIVNRCETPIVLKLEKADSILASLGKNDPAKNSLHGKKM